MGDAHSGKEYLARWVPAVNGVDDRLEVIAGAANGDTAKAVVGAEFEDENIGGLTEGPADAALSIGGCFAAYSGVDNLVGQVEGVEAAADQGGESLIRVEAVAGGETVAKEDDGFASVCGGNGCGRRGGGSRGGIGG